MCRLYGFLATEPTQLDCSLVEAQNALFVQSDRDRRGIRNPDGWGIAEWVSGIPYVTKNTHPAFADRRFLDAAATTYSHAVIAHVRAATVGKVALENSHPFDNGTWAFAHNGTIENIEHVATHLDAGTYGPPQGDTDSELVFRWILNRMNRFGLDPDKPAGGLEPVLDLIEDSIQDLIRISLTAGAEEIPKLNFVISDGRHLVASRWGNSLYWVFRKGISDCAFCGSSHCPSASEGYRAAAVASEPITEEDWIEVPEGTLLGIDSDITTQTRRLVSWPTATVDH
jgi:glutamine amidotransferase